jgi:hypothetical protein
MKSIVLFPEVVRQAADSILFLFSSVFVHVDPSSLFGSY